MRPESPGRAAARACRSAARGLRPRPRCRSSRLSPASSRRARGPGRGILRHLRRGRHPSASAHPGDPAAQLAEAAHAVRRPPREHPRAASHEQPQIAAPREREEGGEDAQLDPQRHVRRDGELEERHREVRRFHRVSARVARWRQAESPARGPRPRASRARAASLPARERDARPLPGGAGSARCCTRPRRAAPPRASRPGATERAPRGASRSHRAQRAFRPSDLPDGPTPPSRSLCTQHAGPGFFGAAVAGAGRPLRLPRAPGRSEKPRSFDAKAGTRAAIATVSRRARAQGGGMTRWSIVLLGGLLAAAVARAASETPRRESRARRWTRSFTRSPRCCRRASTSSASPIRRSARRSWRPSRSSPPPARSSKRTAAAATRASASSRARSPATPRRSAGATRTGAAKKRASCFTRSRKIASPATRACRASAMPRSGAG